MHKRNPYRQAPDFVSLADSYKPLKRHLIPETNSARKTIDFRDAEAQRRLTEAIMFRDFGITLHIPVNRLCPPAPNRLNYILWIQDILHAHDEVLGTRARIVRGIDIGTGSTAIYPFLACGMDKNWTMVATELDNESYASARMNISSNNMQSRIDLRKASADCKILFPLECETDVYQFTMCNPPFYASAEEVDKLSQEKEFEPNAVCTGAAIEMIYEDGGEAGFVARMIKESEQFQTRCKWYTSMLGRMSSVISVVEALRKCSITNYAITEFVQGQTRRWAIAWSYADTHLPDSLARVSDSITPSHALYPVLPPRNTLVQPFPECPSEERLLKVLEEMLQNIGDASMTKVSVGAAAHQSHTLGRVVFFVETQGNTWSRAARRKRPQALVQSHDGSSMLRPPSKSSTLAMSAPVLGCTVRATISSLPSSRTPRTVDKSVTTPLFQVEFQWVFGKDRALFEAFMSHISRRVGTGLI